MQDRETSIVDTEGRRAVFVGRAGDRVQIRLDSGELLSVPKSLLTEGPDGVYRFTRAFRDTLDPLRRGECAEPRAESVEPRQEQVEPVVIEPVVEESLHVAKREVEHERVRVTISPQTREEVVDVRFAHQEISVERVPVGREVESAEGPRQEGATLVVPVYEEVLVVQKKLVLREEVRLTLQRREKTEPRRVELRREEVRIERLSPRQER